MGRLDDWIYSTGHLCFLAVFGIVWYSGEHWTWLDLLMLTLYIAGFLISYACSIVGRKLNDEIDKLNLQIEALRKAQKEEA